MCSCTMELNVKTSRHSTKDIMTLRLSYVKETISPNTLILISVFQVGERTQRGVTNLPQDFWGMSAVSARPVIRTLCKLRVNSSDEAAREDVGKKSESDGPQGCCQDDSCEKAHELYFTDTLTSLPAAPSFTK